jgi:hypothetical protein
MNIRSETIRVLSYYLCDEWVIPRFLPNGTSQAARKVTLRLAKAGLLEGRPLQEQPQWIDGRGMHKIREYRITWYGLLLAEEYLNRKKRPSSRKVTRNKPVVPSRPRVNSVFELGTFL